MHNVILAWDFKVQKTEDDLMAYFRKLMPWTFGDMFEVDGEHINLVRTKDELDDCIINGKCDLAIVNELFAGYRIGTGSISSWKSQNPDCKIILIVANEKISSGKLYGLYNVGYYDAVFAKDMTIPVIRDLVESSRDKESCFDYYGLAFYREVRKNFKIEPIKGDDEAPTKIEKERQRKSSEEPSSDNDKAKKNENNKNKNASRDKNVKSASESNTKKAKPSKTDKAVKTADKAGGKAKKKIAEESVNSDVPKKTVSFMMGGGVIKSDYDAADTAPVDTDENDVSDSKGSKNKKSVKEKASEKDKNTKGEKNAKKSKNTKDTEDSKVKNKENFETDDKKIKVQETADKSELDTSEIKDIPDNTPDNTNSLSEAVTVSENDTENLSDENAPSSSDYDDFWAEDSAENSNEHDDYSSLEYDDSSLDEYLDNEKVEVVNTLDLLIPADIYEKDTVTSMEENSDEEIMEYLKKKEKESLKQFDFDDELSEVDQVQEDLLKYYTQEDPTWLSNMEKKLLTRDEFEAELLRRIKEYNLSEELSYEVFDNFNNFMWDYDILIPFINDPRISDIGLNGPKSIEVKREGKRYLSKKTFRSVEHYKAFIMHLAKRNHVIMDDDHPEKTFMDVHSSNAARLRIVLATEYLNSTGVPTVDIRKVPNTKYSIFDLVEAGMMNYKTAAYLVNKARSGTGIIFTGGMASGKTTLQNTLLEYVSHGKRGLCLQENDELFTNTHPQITFQKLTQSPDGTQVFDLKYLSTFGLLRDIDIFIVGELKSGECKQFVDAVFSNTICWATVHSPSDRDALPRIADLAKYDSDYSEEDLLKRLCALGLVVFIDHFKVKKISEVVGWDAENKCVKYKTVKID